MVNKIASRVDVALRGCSRYSPPFSGRHWPAKLLIFTWLRRRLGHPQSRNRYLRRPRAVVGLAIPDGLETSPPMPTHRSAPGDFVYRWNNFLGESDEGVG